MYTFIGVLSTKPSRSSDVDAVDDGTDVDDARLRVRGDAFHRACGAQARAENACACDAGIVRVTATGDRRRMASHALVYPFTCISLNRLDASARRAKARCTPHRRAHGRDAIARDVRARVR
jgi:hypothetical protein